MVYINYLEKDDDDEDVLINGLLSIASTYGRVARDLLPLNNDLAQQYSGLKSECMREVQPIDQYRHKAQSLLINFSGTYLNICEENNLLDKRISGQIMIKDLFGIIASYQESKVAAPVITTLPSSRDQTSKATDTTYSKTDITVGMIIEGVKRHFDETKKLYGVGQWPSCKDYSSISDGPLRGESFGTIDKHLRDGGRGLPGESSLSQLMEEHGLGSHITIQDILDAAKLHFFQTKEKTGVGKWPSSSDRTRITSGPLEGKTWKGIDTAFHRGYFNLPSDTTLSCFLKENGCFDSNIIDPSDVVEAAKLHYSQMKEKTGRGRWPSSKDNKVIETGPLKGEKWSSIHTAIRDGYRGFDPTEGGLPAFLRAHDCYDRAITKNDIIVSALYYKTQNKDNKWPSNKTKAPVCDDTVLHGMTWASIDKRKIEGMSLFQIISEYEQQPDIYQEAKKATDEIIGNLSQAEDDHKFEFDSLDL
tara:strand:- start:743 stop:2167 length:1425 start_codon:yes stop_codon:yes gene_type:complete